MNRSFISRLATIVLSVALLQLFTACASLTSYSITESDLKGYLLTALADFDRQQLEAGSPLGLRVRDASVDLGPGGRDVIRIKLDGTASVNALLAKIPADFMLDIEGTPVFDNEEKAIYVRRFNLNDANIEVPFFKQNLKPVTKQILAVVTQYLETVPVYRLEQDSMFSSLTSLQPMQIKVTKGRINLVPQAD